jgi:F0F1-type ATP synthase delta subunit
MSAAEAVVARFSGTGAARAVATNLVLAVGARTPLTVEQLDELTMAVDAVLTHSQRPTVTIDPTATGMRIRVGPADIAWVERNRQLLEPLVTGLDLDGEDVALEVG